MSSGDKYVDEIDEVLIDTDAIRAVVGATSASRGFQYASTSRVGRVGFDPETGLLTAQVAGSIPRPYRVRVWLQPSVAPDLQPEGTDPMDMEWEPVHGECTCPVGTDCKHVAAVCYRAVRLRSDDALGRAKSDLSSHERAEPQHFRYVPPSRRSVVPPALIDFASNPRPSVRTDPFADEGDPLGTTEDVGSQSNYIHIRIQQRNGRKTLTTLQGLPKGARATALRYLRFVGADASCRV